jgi:hypothetical protein
MKSQSQAQNLQNSPSSVLVLHDITLHLQHIKVFSMTVPKQAGISVYMLKIQQHMARQGTRSMVSTSPVLAFFTSSSSLMVVCWTDGAALADCWFNCWNSFLRNIAETHSRAHGNYSLPNFCGIQGNSTPHIIAHDGGHK